MNAIYLIPVNLYGPRDNFDLETSHVIPAIIRKCVTAMESRADHIRLWGDGTPTREFLFVEDAAEAILLATERYDGSESINIGTGQDISIRDLATLISDEVGFSGTIEWDTSIPNGQPRRCLDATRAKECFGFKASQDLRDGISETVNGSSRIAGPPVMRGWNRSSTEFCRKSAWARR